jgi:hypothetical protein
MTAPPEDPRVLEFRLANVNRVIDRALDNKDRQAFFKARGLRMQLLAKLAKLADS